MQIKSKQQAEALYKSNSSKSSTFGLQTVHQIEREFQQMSDKYRKQTSNQSVLMTRRDAITNQKEVRIRSHSTNLEDNGRYQEDSMLPRFIKQCFHKSIKDESHQQICRMFGSKLTGSIMEGLILQSIYKVNYDNRTVNAGQDYENQVIQNYVRKQNIMKQFDISKIKLDLIKKGEDKVGFILESMQQNINTHFENLNKQMLESYKQQFKFDNQYKQLVEQNDRQLQKQDQLTKQILMKSRFKAIQGKLWQALVSKLGEYENQMILHHAISTGEKVTQLHNFTGVSTNDVIRSEIESNKKNSFHPSEVKKIQRGSSQPNISKPLYTIDSWGENDETTYVKKSKVAKELYRPDHKNLIAIGFQENIYKKIKKEENLLEREFLFQKYLDEGLTAQEIKFLNDTCELINKNIDKEFEKKKLRALDQELINQIELKVVQELLSGFNFLRRELLKARKEFIERKNKEAQQLIKQKGIKQLQLDAFQERRRLVKERADLYGYKVDQMARQKKFENPNVKIYVKMFVEGLKRNVQTKKKQRQEMEQNKFLRQDQVEFRKRQIFFVSSTVKQEDVNWDKYFNQKKHKTAKSASVDFRLKKAQYHPPSKLLVFRYDEMKEQREQAIKKFAEQFSQAKLFYEISYDQDPRFKDKSRFVSFYTGGPELQEAQRAELKQRSENIEFLNYCATKIQKVYKAHVVRKNFRNQLEQREQDLKDQVYKIVDNIRIKKWDGLLSSLRAYKNQKRRVSIFGSFYRDKSTKGQNQYINPLDPRFKVEETIEFQSKSNANIIKTLKEFSRDHSLQRTERSVSTHRTRQDSSRKFIKEILNQKIKEQNQSSINVSAAKGTDKFTQRQFLMEKLRALFRMAKFHKNESQYIQQSTAHTTADEVNILDNDGYSALYHACLRGCLPVVKFIHKRLNGNINQKCARDETPLHAAMRSGNQELILYLIQSPDCDFNALNAQNLTPLGLCSESLLKELGIQDKVVVSVRDKYILKVNKRSIPRTIDNNKIVQGKKFENSSTEIPGRLSFSYQAMESSQENVRGRSESGRKRIVSFQHS